MDADRTEMRRVEWSWWYPGDCIRTPGWDEHILAMNIASYEADDVAAEIVQKYVEENSTDGANSFEIEINSPSWAAGIYDVTLDWEPVASATRRQKATAE